jgi:CheY-like chemotaxis protein
MYGGGFTGLGKDPGGGALLRPDHIARAAPPWGHRCREEPAIVRAPTAPRGGAASQEEIDFEPCPKRVCAAVRAEAGEVAHDLNNQLAVVLANASFARENTRRVPDVEAPLCDIECAAARCADLTQRLLQLAQRITHPASAAGAPQSASGVKKASNGRFGETVLLAESESLVRRALWRALRIHGFRVLLARNGDEALSRYLRHRAEVSLVVLDRVMPRRGGFEVLSTIRDSAPHMPAIVLSGSYGTTQSSAILNTAILGKPIDAAKLAHHARQLIDRVVD